MRSSAVPLGHKFTAVLVAAAVGGGVYAWLRYNAAEKATTAELSFDMHAARRIDAGFVQAHDPAVAFAQSVLTDQRIAELSKGAYLSTSEMMSRVGEYRSRLELTEAKPASGTVLRVGFQDTDAAKGIATANAVANALATWAPSPDGPAALTEPSASPATSSAVPRAPAAKAQPAPAHAKAAAQKPVVRHESAAEGSLATALEGIHDQLVSTDAKVDRIARGEGPRGRAYAKSDEQQVLKDQVGAAEKKVADLREQATGSDRDRLGTIHEALASILSGHRVGVSTSEIRRERDGLTEAIAVVEQQRQAVEKEESTSTEPTPAEAADAAPAQSAGSAVPAAASAAGSTPDSGAITESNLGGNGSQGAGANGTRTQPGTAGNAPTADSADAAMLDPLHVVRLAGTATGPVVWWPAAVAGVVCGLLYFLIAAARQPRYEDYESDMEVAPSYGRFITPDAPAAVAQAPMAEAEPVVPAGLYERGSQRRASFTYEPSPEEMQAGATAGRGVEPEAGPAGDVRSAAIVEEKVVQMDPWMDLMQKALSETEIGRRLESPADREERMGGEAGELRPGRPDRRAS